MVRVFCNGEVSTKDATFFTVVPPRVKEVIEPKGPSSGQGRSWVLFVVVTDFPLYRDFIDLYFIPLS